jgi:hypothetical protein
MVNLARLVGIADRSRRCWRCVLRPEFSQLSDETLFLFFKLGEPILDQGGFPFGVEVSLAHGSLNIPFLFDERKGLGASIGVNRNVDRSR